MTDEELQAIKARADAATPGPWLLRDSVIFDPGDYPVAAGNYDGGVGASERDLAFIVAARQDVPALVAEVEQLRKSQGALIALVTEAAIENIDTNYGSLGTRWQAKADAALAPTPAASSAC